MPVAAQFLTHTVDNQAPPLRDLNLYASDLALREAVAARAVAGVRRTCWPTAAIAGGE